ncbi:MAG: hypothetical protein GF320_00480 [Armatimonadia bacterium]|nr:hypothetical protein [Armatimonadia bacterium]
MHEWQPITDLPENWGDLRVGGVVALAAIWARRHEWLRERGADLHALDEVCMEWAVETGQIEGVYSLGRGITQSFLARGILPDVVGRPSQGRSQQEIAAIVRDHRETLDHLFDFVAQRRELTVGYVRELHAALTRSQSSYTAYDSHGQPVETPLHHGKWKTQENNPSRPDTGQVLMRYCPPVHVAQEMDNLIGWHQEHVADEIPPEVEAAWLHHRFTLIHPFEDGNGRVARALATLVFLRAQWAPLVVTRDDRADYLAALEAADAGQLALFVDVLAGLQQRLLDRLLAGTTGYLTPEQRLEERLDVAAARLELQGRGLGNARGEMDRLSRTLAKWAAPVARSLVKTAQRRLGSEVAVTGSHVEHGPSTTGALALGDPSTRQILPDGYSVSLRAGSAAADLLLVSYGVSSQPSTRFAALVAAIPGVEPWDHPAYDPVFQHWLGEPEDEVQDRFEEWFQEALLWGLDQWIAQL